ncbi:hypothetical protein [Pseudomonas moraviensis]|uniref:hypothetical protein n=1 Tax=Pseudomonas moraviensis TaxID=321662 RepID=UPI0034A05B4C
MQISFTIDADAFEQEQKEPVKKTLRIGDAEIAHALERIAKASLTEYLKMLVEGGMPSRADEAKQDRLLYLIQSYFGQTLPTESQISTIFQLTPEPKQNPAEEHRFALSQPTRRHPAAQYARGDRVRRTCAKCVSGGDQLGRDSRRTEHAHYPKRADLQTHHQTQGQRRAIRDQRRFPRIALCNAGSECRSVTSSRSVACC